MVQVGCFLSICSECAKSISILEEEKIKLVRRAKKIVCVPLVEKRMNQSEDGFDFPELLVPVVFLIFPFFLSDNEEVPEITRAGFTQFRKLDLKPCMLGRNALLP